MSPVSRKTALVLEDEPIIAMGLSMQLRKAGFADIMTFDDCHEALSHLNQPGSSLPDLSILDVQLRAGNTSLDVARFLQNRGGKFFVLSGYGANNALTTELTGVRAIRKPVCEDILFEMIEETLGDNVH